MTQTLNKVLINNAGLIELYKLVIKLYGKNLVSKIDIRELTNSLKHFTDHLPDQPDEFQQ